MSRNRFVRADTTRLDLSEGDWIEVKEDISFGEDQRLNGLMVAAYRPAENGAGNQWGIEWARYVVARIETWLVDWSFRDERDKPVPLSRQAIENLGRADAQEILDALNAHEAAQKKGETSPTSSANGKVG